MPVINKDLEGWTFLKNVANEQEAVMVESILGTEGIPIQRKHKEMGSYLEVYMGLSAYGIDLFIPEDAMELAKGLLDSEMLDMPEEIGRDEVVKAAEKYQSKRRGIVWIILMYLFLPVAAVILWNILNR